MTDYNNDFNEMTMTCDNQTCGEQSTFIGEFKECVNEAKEEGWKIFQKHPGEWNHTCPMCSHTGLEATEVFKNEQ